MKTENETEKMQHMAEDGNPTTRTLDGELVQIDEPEELNQYLKKIGNIGKPESFCDYFFRLEKVQCIPDRELREKSGLERSYYYHIRDGSKRPGRDKIIRLCLAAGLDDDEARRAFEAAGAPYWYARDRRDAVIRFCLKKSRSVMETNLLLEEYGMELI